MDDWKNDRRELIKSAEERHDLDHLFRLAAHFAECCADATVHADPKSARVFAKLWRRADKARDRLLGARRG